MLCNIKSLTTRCLAGGNGGETSLDQCFSKHRKDEMGTEGPNRNESERGICQIGLIINFADQCV